MATIVLQTVGSVVGGMVGVVLISMYMPIFDLAGKIKAE